VFKADPRFRQLLEPPLPDSYRPSMSEFMELVNETMNIMQGKILENADDNIAEKIIQQRTQMEFFESMLTPYFTKLLQK
jgi:hypothetical protein